jgi:hypothetical protein
VKRPGYHAFLPASLVELEKQPEIAQFWLAWGAVWAVVGPILCVALWLDWGR